MGHTTVCSPGFEVTIFSSLPNHPSPPGTSQAAQNTLLTNDSDLSSKRLALVVDDVADVTEMIAVFLSKAGYEVTTASSAFDALSVAREIQFHVIISDIGMPDMDGYELAGALRMMPGYQSVTLIAVTGFAQFDDRERSLRSGFNAHMTKPIEPRALLDLIEQLS